MSQRLRITGLPDIFGADGGKNEDEDEDADEREDEDLDEDEDEDDEPEESVETLKEKLAKAEAERERAHRRMRRADRAKSKADNELATLRNGTQKDLADANAEIERLKAELAQKSGTDTTSIVREEFRDNTKVKWHNPKLAFELLDLDEVDVDDNGKVDAASLNDAIEKLAKDHPYLVKTDKAGDSEDEDEEEDKRPKPRSGSQPSGSRKSARDKRNQEIASRYKISGRVPS